MAIDSGHGGTATIISANTTIEVQVRRWNIEHSIQLHDTTVMGSTTRGRTTGLEDWNATLEFFGASDSNVNTLKAGTATTNFTLTATSGGANNTYSGTGVVETIQLSRDVDSAVQGTLRIMGNGTLTLPASV